MKSVLLRFTGDGFAQACLVDGSLANRGRCPTTDFRKSARGHKDLEESSALKSVVGRPPTSALKTVLTTQSIANGHQRTQKPVKQALLGCWSMGLQQTMFPSTPITGSGSEIYLSCTSSLITYHSRTVFAQRWKRRGRECGSAGARTGS